MNVNKKVEEVEQEEKEQSPHNSTAQIDTAASIHVPTHSALSRTVPINVQQKKPHHVIAVKITCDNFDMDSAQYVEVAQAGRHIEAAVGTEQGNHKPEFAVLGKADQLEEGHRSLAEGMMTSDAVWSRGCFGQHNFQLREIANP